MSTKKKLVNVLTQSLYFVMVYLAVYMQIPGAVNVVVFWTFLIAFFSLTLFNTDVRKVIAVDYFKNPAWLRSGLVIIKIGIVGVFVWYGWTATAIAYFFHVLMIVSLTAIKD